MATAVLPPQALVPEGIRGERFKKGDEGYEKARWIFNMRKDNEHPGLIVRPVDVADLQAIMRHADANNIPVAVRGGGHGPDGAAMPHNQLVVDMSQWRDVHIDPTTRVVRAAAGAVLEDLDLATSQQGLVVPAGTVSHTGIAGLTLAGGVGFNMRRFGATVDQLLALELVTADGRFVRADKNQNAELYWALRGAGGNFGVVTTFEYQGHPYPPKVGQGYVAFPLSQAKSVWPKAVECSKRSPRELSLVLTILPLPPWPGIPQHLLGVPGVLIVTTFSGEYAKFNGLLQTVAELGNPITVQAAAKSWPEANSYLNVTAPYGRRCASRGTYLAKLTDEMMDIIIEGARQAPRPPKPGPSVVQELWLYEGGAIADDYTEDSCAFSREGTLGFWECVSQWDDPDLDEVNSSWVNGLGDKFPDGLPNGYSNFSWDLGPEWVRGLFGKEEKWQRLLAVKKEWDPKNLFRFNKNIPVN